MKKMARWMTLIGLWLCTTLAQAGTHHYYYTDPQGTVLAKADASGTIIATYEYAPYGTAVASMSPAPNGPGYTGHVNDPESGFVYMQARYYDPAVGRFLSLDPIGPGAGNEFNFNRFNYASNNPIANIDPDGRSDTPFGDCSSNPNCTLEVDNTSGNAAGAGSPRPAQAPIIGKGQVSSKTPTHASTSERIAKAMAARPKTKAVYLNRSLRTITGDKSAPNIKPDVTAVNHDGTIDMVEVRSLRQTEGALVDKLANARSALGRGGENIVEDFDPISAGAGLRSTTMEAFGTAGIIEMIFHAYVDYKVDQRQHPNETPEQRDQRKQFEAACASSPCI